MQINPPINIDGIREIIPNKGMSDNGSLLDVAIALNMKIKMIDDTKVAIVDMDDPINSFLENDVSALSLTAN